MQKNIEDKYLKWLNEPSLTADERAELKSIVLNHDEIIDRFGQDLEFGTGGLRGVMGIGSNRMNIYTVRRATQGLANYLLEINNIPSVAIAFDSRHNSREFALEAAKVLAANHIKVFIYKELMPTPALSFAVRHLKCTAGIVITASHNPKQYNGYKVYGEDGCQMTIKDADAVFQQIEKVDIFNDVLVGNFDKLVIKGTINFIDESFIKDYFQSDLRQSIIPESVLKRDLKLVYTPLHGAGLYCVITVLNNDGFQDIEIVPEQMNPDGDFTTCPYPNPEMKEALQVGIQYLINDKRDLLIATDPDSDRVGVVVNQKGTPVILTGNEVGILLFDFIYQMRKKQGTLPKKPVAIKTIVSSDMVNIMAKQYGVTIIEVLTGFKFIGEQILYLERKGEENRFIFGYEESCGYLTNPDVRDKDAVNASLLVAEMANYYKSKGLTLCDKLKQLYAEFGDYKTETMNFQFPGLDGKDKIEALMKTFRTEEIKEEIGKVDHVGDYLTGVISFADHKEPTNLPKSDVVKFFLDGGETITIRPSGTEPKLKAYIFAKGEKNLKKYQTIINEIIG